jgi:hypothetical protein
MDILLPGPAGFPALVAAGSGSLTGKSLDVGEKEHEKSCGRECDDAFANHLIPP